MSKRVSTDWQPVDIEKFKVAPHNYFVQSMGCEVKFRDVEAQRASVITQFRVDNKWTEPGLIPAIVRLYRWPLNHVDVPLEDFAREALVRPPLKEAKGWNAWIDEIAVGDFVRCKNQRNAKVWKKIIAINDHQIVSMQYRQPIDDPKHLDGHSSENFIWFIKEKHS